MSNAEKIERIALEMIDDSVQHMKAKVKKAIKSGALDIENWDEYNKPMIIPKVIIQAVLQSESEQYSPKGTSFEREINKEVKNLRYYIWFCFLPIKSTSEMGCFFIFFIDKFFFFVKGNVLILIEAKIKKGS